MIAINRFLTLAILTSFLVPLKSNAFEIITNDFGDGQVIRINYKSSMNMFSFQATDGERYNIEYSSLYETNINDYVTDRVILVKKLDISSSQNKRYTKCYKLLDQLYARKIVGESVKIKLTPTSNPMSAVAPTDDSNYSPALYIQSDYNQMYKCSYNYANRFLQKKTKTTKITKTTKK